jgi:hypothetical protein
MNNIFLTPGRHAEWRSLLERGDPVAKAMAGALEPGRATRPSGDGGSAAERSEAMDDAVNSAALAWLNEDRSLAEGARTILEEQLHSYDGADLGKAANALTAVLVWDFCRDLWEEAKRRSFADRIAAIARSFLTVSKGNPHIVTNNWWMLTHGGCLLACIAVDGEEGVTGPIDLTDLKAWALERFKAFCHVFGSAGLYHEGSGYIAYTLSMLMPAMVAVERHLEPDILEEFPQFRKSIASMLVGTATFEHQDSGADQPSFGASLQWNDAGRGCVSLNPAIPGMLMAPDQWRGALRAWLDRLLLLHEEPKASHYRGLPLAVALYPFSTTKMDPEAVLPKWVLDQRQGLGMWRSEWGSGSESVFGWYARSTHAGGHSQDDAASIRLMALGRTWICGGGQARPRAEWQSAFTHADASDRPKPAPLAHISSCKLSDSGGVVAMDTRQSLGAYSERYLSWHKDLGYPFVLAVMDLLDEHRDPPLDWQWNLSFPREIEGRIHEDGAGFTLIDTARGRLTGRFLIDRPARLEISEMPASTRTYSNGKKVDYPGDRFLHSCFPQQKQSRILVAMVLTPASSLEDPKISFRDNAIVLDGKPWRHPFSPAILQSVDLAQSAPNRMTRPAG